MKYFDMTPSQRDGARKLQNKLCVQTAEYKGVNAMACVQCESPCQYGTELADLLGLPRPRKERPLMQSGHVVAMMDRPFRRIIRAINKRR